MANDPNISILLDIYGNMLTEKQRDCLDLFYNQDLSFSEIGQHYEITRQGACDFITRGRLMLLEMENKIGYLSRLSQIQDSLGKIVDISNKLLEYNKENLESFIFDEGLHSINEIAQNLSLE